MSLRPSLKEMLVVGNSCGLKTLDEAYDNYLNHYTMFFLIDDFDAQYISLIKEMDNYNLIIRGGDVSYLKDVCIGEVMEMLEYEN